MSSFSHKFLNCKQFHPKTKANIKRKWQAEQQQIIDAARAKERQQLLKKERAAERLGKTDGRLSFIYKAPPGMEGAETSAAQTDEPVDGGEEKRKKQKKSDGGRSGGGRTVKEIEEAHGLANAPVEAYAKGLKVHLNPLGAQQIRNVVCLRCKQHGHMASEKECPMLNNAIDLPANRWRSGDPLAAMMTSKRPDEPRAEQPAARFEIRKQTKAVGGDIIDDELNQFVEIPFEDSAEAQFIASLSHKEQKKLLKKINKKQKKEKKQKKKQKKRKK